jgi:hypothetical protein
MYARKMVQSLLLKNIKQRIYVDFQKSDQVELKK